MMVADSAKDGNAKSQKPSGKARKQTHRVKLKRLSEVRPEMTQWVWPDVFPRGVVTMVSGDGGVGKSTLMGDVTARITVGAKWPLSDEVAPLGSVIYFGSEDGLADGLVPRILAAGGDPSRVHIIEGKVNTDRPDDELDEFDLQRDADKLAVEIEGLGDVQLVVVDPVTDWLRGDLNDNANVRRQLKTLVLLAREANIAIVIIAHHSKADTKTALHKVCGSIGFGNTVRLHWSVYKAMAGSINFVQAKTNKRNGKGFSFQMESVYGTTDGAAWEAGKVVWGERIEITAEQAMEMSVGTSRAGRPDKLPAAMKLIQAELAAGPRPSDEVIAKGATLGFSQSLMRKARSELGAVSVKLGMTGGWQWSLPPAEDSAPGEIVNLRAAQAENPKNHDPENLCVFEELRPDAEPEDAQISESVILRENLACSPKKHKSEEVRACAREEDSDVFAEIPGAGVGVARYHL